jgi:putative membrane protein
MLMNFTGFSWVAVLAVTVGLGSCSKGAPEERLADGVAIGTGGAAASVTSDVEFVHDVTIMNMAATELSLMALNKATRPDIKSFAQRVLDDHAEAENKLKIAVSGHSMDWPAQIDNRLRETADKLAKKHGTDFDRDYTDAMVEGHQDLAGLLESRLDLQSVADWNTAAGGRTQSHALPEPNVTMRDVQPRPNKSDDEFTMKINQWAAETYPIAQKHLDTARTLKNAAKNSTAGISQ